MNTSLFRVTLKQLSIYVVCIPKKPTKNSFIFYFCPQTCWASLFLSSFLILEFSPPSMALYFFWFNIHCCFQIFNSLLVTPFFPLLFTSFILSIYNSLSDPFNYFLPIPLPLLLSLLTFCVRPSLLPRINGLILLLKQMSIRAQ